MSTTCTDPYRTDQTPQTAAAVPLPFEVPSSVLRTIVERYGTPTYAYDIARIRTQVAALRAHLPQTMDLLYSLKANPSLGLCGVLAASGLGADVASAGEIVTARAAGFAPRRMILTGPDRSPAVLAALHSMPEIAVSVDSLSELRHWVAHDPRRRLLLRLRPDFCSFATCSAGPDSRFGLVMDELPACRALLAERAASVVGFHVFSGSQVLTAEGVIHHLHGGAEQANRAAEILGIAPAIIDLGGGFGVPYGPADRELDLAAVGAALQMLATRAAPARLVLELGRYFVAQSGWYLVTVLAEQTHRGRKAVVVDGGSHQRADMCGVGLRHKGHAPTVLNGRVGLLAPTDVLGCLSLPADVLLEAAPLPPLAPGDVLAFPNAGAYGLGASPWSFHVHPAPAEIAFDGDIIQPLRTRRSAPSVLDDQQLLPPQGAVSSQSART
jgi:diaminopimelate decarboxylase